MKAKVSRSRMDVNLEELDAIIDGALQAPLSESDGRKLKTALHAMAERLVQPHTTPKTKAVLPKSPPPAIPEDISANEAGPEGKGHGRIPAAAFTGAQRVIVQHETLQSGDPCPECGSGKVYTRESRKLWFASSGRHR